MVSNSTIRPAINDYLRELGLFLSLRISAYHQKHKSPVDFLNEFIVCPQKDNLHPYLLRDPAAAREHFEENLVNDVTYVALYSLSLTPQREIEYRLGINPNVTEEEEDECEEVFEIAIVGSMIEPVDQEYIDWLETFDDKALKKAVKKLKGEMSFGTLKQT